MMAEAQKITAQRPGIWQILIVAPPLIAAFSAVPLVLFWIMGASAFSGTDKSWVFNLSFWTILAYVAVYSVLMICVGICTLFKWRIVGVLHGLIWLCCIAFVVITVWAFSVLSAPI